MPGGPSRNESALFWGAVGLLVPSWRRSIPLPRLNNKAEAVSLAGWSYTDRVRCRALGVVLLAVLRHASEGPHLVSHIDGAGRPRYPDTYVNAC